MILRSPEAISVLDLIVTKLAVAALLFCRGLCKVSCAFYIELLIYKSIREPKFLEWKALSVHRFVRKYSNNVQSVSLEGGGCIFVCFYSGILTTMLTKKSSIHFFKKNLLLFSSLFLAIDSSLKD